MVMHRQRLRPRVGELVGVVVGVVDVGFDLTHPNFYDSTTTNYRIKRFWDQLSVDTLDYKLFVGRDYTTEAEILAYAHSRDGLVEYHGTHTLGSAAGSGAGTVSSEFAVQMKSTLERSYGTFI